MGYGSIWKLPIVLASAMMGLSDKAFSQDAVKLLRLRKLSHTADALPRIAHPNPAQAKINHSFALLDRKARGWADSCRGQSEEGDEMFYNRSVDVTSQGPLFLSANLTEEIGCEGVHPYVNLLSLTYDLHTGKPVRWADLLTKVYVREVSVNPGNMQPFPIFGISSLPLQKLYSAGWKNDEQCRLEDVVDRSGATLTTFLLSPASNRKGLSVLPAGLASVVANCALSITLGKSAMDALGIPEDVQESLLVE